MVWPTAHEALQVRALLEITSQNARLQILAGAIGRESGNEFDSLLNHQPLQVAAILAGAQGMRSGMNPRIPFRKPPVAGDF